MSVQEYVEHSVFLRYFGGHDGVGHKREMPRLIMAMRNSAASTVSNATRSRVALRVLWLVRHIVALK